MKQSWNSLEDLCTPNLKEAWERFEPSISLLQWGSKNFWIVVFFIFCVISGYIKQTEYAEYESWMIIGTSISLYMIWKRIGYGEWFMDWYEAWYSDWTKNTLKHERKWNDEDISNIEEMEILWRTE